MAGALSDSKKELLDRLVRGGARSVARPDAIARRSTNSEAPLSYGQQQVWLHSQYSTEIPLYNEPVTVHRFGPLDRNALERAFTEIIARHEAWRTVFRWNGPKLVQVIEPAPEHIEIPFVDLSSLPAPEREQAALKEAMADALIPFDLAAGPMYRPRLVRFSAEEHRLYLALHHIMFDGVSLYRVFLPELQTLYEAFSNGRPSPLQPLTLQYADFAIWHREWVDRITPLQLPYWRAKLENVVRQDILPTDHPRSRTQSFRGAMETLALSPEMSSALKELSFRADATLFMTLLAAFHAVIWAYSRANEIVSGGTSGGRSRSETYNMLGFFLNTIVLRTDMSGDPDFLELIARGKEELLSSLANDGIPFENLVKELAPQREGGVNPFFQVSFSFEPPLAPLGPNWKFTQMDVETGAAKFDLHLELDEREEGIVGRFIYNADLFERATIEDLLKTWRNLISSAVADPTRRLSQLVPELCHLRKILPARAEPALQESRDLPQPKPKSFAASILKAFRSR